MVLWRLLSAIDMNRDINNAHWICCFFLLGWNIAGSVFGYRSRLDRPTSHQHCFHLIVPHYLKTFWDDSDWDNQDDLEDGNQDLPRTSSPQKGTAKFWDDVVVLQWWQRNALKFTAHARSTVVVLLLFLTRFSLPLIAENVIDNKS